MKNTLKPNSEQNFDLRIFLSFSDHFLILSKVTFADTIYELKTSPFVAGFSAVVPCTLQATQSAGPRSQSADPHDPPLMPDPASANLPHTPTGHSVGDIVPT